MGGWVGGWARILDPDIYSHRFCIRGWLQPRCLWLSGLAKCPSPNLGLTNSPFRPSSHKQPFHILLRASRPTSMFCNSCEIRKSKPNHSKQVTNSISQVPNNNLNGKQGKAKQDKGKRNRSQQGETQRSNLSKATQSKVKEHNTATCKAHQSKGRQLKLTQITEHRKATSIA